MYSDPCCKGWVPWKVVAISLAAQGGFSYMGDVHTFGRDEIGKQIRPPRITMAWSELDVVMAVTNVFVFISLLG